MDMLIYGMHTQRNLPIVVPEKPVVLYFQPPARQEINEA